MGDSPRGDLKSAYRYLQHPLPIDSENPRTLHPQHAAVVGATPSLSLPRRAHPLPHPLPYFAPLAHAHLAHLAPPPPRQNNALLLLHPLLHLTRIDELPSQPSRALPCPTVIVSPHYQSPTTERDPARPVVKKPSSNNAHARQDTDGHKGQAHSVQSSAPTMTSNGTPAAQSKRDDRQQQQQQQQQQHYQNPSQRQQRPSIVSHHSNSVPSTPLQAPRQYESRSRSPSPNGGLGSHSPRSVSSEANGAMPTLRAGRVYKCQYETNAGLGRRRMPYTSSDLLEKAKEEPKKTLDPSEDGKLSGDMRELYGRLLPSQENADNREKFVRKLQSILETEWPGNEFKVHVFGSSGNMLYTGESDVDVCIQTPMKRLEEMHCLADALARNGMERVVCVPQAKVKIVKVWDPVLKLACDMNVNNTLALENTRMIKTYIQIDERVRPLAMIIKYWTKQRILNDAALGGTISSYTWICMILNFLQTRDPPILPSLHESPHRATDKPTGKPSQSAFADDLDKLRGFGKDNKETLGQLLFNFFRRYGHEIDYEKYVISVRQGRLLTREEKNWHLEGLQKEARNRLCVEEPFNIERNLGNSADDFAWRGIHLEIRRAFDLLAEGQQLTKACEQFEFPPEEKNPALFKKPTSSKPTLTSSVPSIRSGRGGSGHRGGRGGYNQKNGNYGRRSSSSASYNSNRPYLNSPPIPTMAAQDYFPRGLNEQLHDQLFQQYQMLEMQSNSLRAQLAMQQQRQQAQQVHAAQLHAHSVAQAQAQAHSRGVASTNGSPQKSPYVNGRTSPRLADLSLPANAGLPQGFLYHYPGFFDPSQGNTAAAQDASRTNPSSPSLANSVPGLRRGAHRASNASDSGSIRSQSQPARAGAQQPVVAGYAPMPYYDPTTAATFAGYPIARSTQEIPNSQPTADPQYSPLSGYPEPVPGAEHGTPKEYVGYSFAEQPPARSLQEYTPQQIPSYTELAQRRRRVSSEITQPLLNTALRRVSRSPSPLGGHVRSYSTGIAAQQGQNSQHRKDRIDSTHPAVDNGPVIVNGSFPSQPLPSRPRSDTVESVSPADTTNPSPLGIYLNNQDQSRMSNVEQQRLIVEELQRQKAEIIQASIANGSIKEGPMADMSNLARVPSASQQTFTNLPEGWINYDSSGGDQGNHSDDVSPTRVQPQQHWRPAPYTNGLNPLDTMNAPRAPPQEIKSAGLPLLSPVFETRTPSPTVTRQPEPSKLANGLKPQGKENNNAQPRRSSHTPASAPKENNQRNQHKSPAQGNDKGGKASAGNNSPNTWQQSHGKRKKKGKPGNKSTDTKPAGEPLPANVADRKGG
ncbi:hypothetical protein BS50DRAFT_627414 [Corynespora cassiicola Philippines]|uniref:polynucleotide adenylyltransferase n=1 Tax=Corynespora cassiicola Philippines TaxID=1448308 RepID=A0A2T2P9L1_CORCC|nr:hypothetical protein BS50DRAFT_627414 [Corynespora cassiicola Philippines]